MTDQADSTSAPGEGVDWADDDLPIQRVRDLFVNVGKAFRAYQLYDENNPVRQRFVDALRSDFAGLWTEVDKLVVTMDEDHFYLAGHSVYKAESRNDSLAFLFFKDGVREVTFLPGLEERELQRFLGVLQKARKLVPEGDDLLTVLWEEDLQCFTYQYVDLLAEGVSLPEAGEGNSQAELQAAMAAEDQEIAEQADAEASDSQAAASPDAPQTVRQDDFNPTLYALDPREMKILEDELRKEMQRDVRDDVLNALLDRLEDPDNRARQSEILGVLDTLLPNFLSRGALAAATKVLRELGRLEGIEGMFGPTQREESNHILDGISASDAIDEVIRALYDGTIRASPAQLGSFLEYLRGSALSPLLRCAETVDHKELQAVLRKAVQGIGTRHRSALVGLLREDDPVLARSAARLVGDMQIPEAGPELARLLSHEVAEVRLAAIQAAVALRASTVSGALQAVLDDPEREVRIEAARALGALKYTPASNALGQIVRGKRIRNADITEKVAVFEAYGTIAGAGGVGLLDGLLNKKGLLGKREAAEVRAAAALGLGCIGTADAQAALQRAASDDDPVVRSSVNRALRQEG